jgi:hypothetical protein
MARLVLCSISPRALLEFQCKRLSGIDILRNDCMCVLNMSGTLDAVMVVYCELWLTLDFLRRVKENAEKRRQAKGEGSIFPCDVTDLATVHLKRQPVMPREAKLVKSPEGVETLHPIPYDTRI